MAGPTDSQAAFAQGNRLCQVALDQVQLANAPTSGRETERVVGRFGNPDRFLSPRDSFGELAKLGKGNGEPAKGDRGRQKRQAEALGPLPLGTSLVVLHGVGEKDAAAALNLAARPCLNTPEQVARWRKVAPNRPCDVMVDSFRPRTAVRLGLDSTALRARDRLAYAYLMSRHLDFALRFLPGDLQGSDGVFRVGFENLEEAFRELLKFGPDAEVLEPPELRTRIADTAQQVADLYAVQMVR